MTEPSADRLLLIALASSNRCPSALLRFTRSDPAMGAFQWEAECWGVALAIAPNHAHTRSCKARSLARTGKVDERQLSVRDGAADEILAFDESVEQASDAETSNDTW